ncbi:MAG: efflux RND transporter periplasmic adaptor subunit [Clostridiales bacterium]|nr:efflux RND transporter periplasmic adaptor subunit [Clostridiales bacterium]
MDEKNLNSMEEQPLEEISEEQFFEETSEEQPFSEILEEQSSDETSEDEGKKKIKLPKLKGKKSGGSKKKRIIAIIVIIALIFAAVKIISSRSSSSSESSTYTYGTAVRTTITNSIEGSGTLEPADSYTVSTLVRGDVLSDYFEEGDTVEKGQVLYELDSSDMETSIEKAQLSVSSAQRNYSSSVKDLENLNVTTKVAGTVTEVLVDVGDKVSSGQQVATVRDDSEMTLTLPFPADEAENFYIGQTAEVTLYGSFETLYGTVTSISGSTQVSTGNMMTKNVEITVENPGAISESKMATATVGSSGSTQSGTFTFKEDRTIYAEVSGEVASIVNDEGSTVSAGSTILILESDSVTNSVQSAADNVTEAQLSLDNQYDSLEDYTITSPIEGTVIVKNVKAGDTIDDDTSKLCVIYDLLYLTITMNIDELDINSIEVGQEVTITADAVDGETFIGYVSKINLTGSTTNGVTTYPVTVRIDEPGDELLPGMNVDTEIIIGEAEDVIAVPTSAVVRGDMVLVKTGASSSDSSIPDGYEYVSVETGISNDSYVEIKSGLEEGDEIAYIYSSSSDSTDMMMMGGGMAGGGMGGGGNMGGGGGGPM